MFNQYDKKMKNLVNEFQKLNSKGARFISINGYLSATSGELANHVINTGVSIENAKRGDLKRLKNCSEADIIAVSQRKNIALDVVRTALSELIASAEKNLSAKLEDRSAQSQAQTDAYITITPAVKLHKETLAIHIFGQAISKEVIIPGEYKSVNSSDKTIAKNSLKKQLKLRSDKFRNFILGNVDDIKMNGKILEVVLR